MDTQAKITVASVQLSQHFLLHGTAAVQREQQISAEFLITLGWRNVALFRALCVPLETESRPRCSTITLCSLSCVCFVQDFWYKSAHTFCYIHHSEGERQDGRSNRSIDCQTLGIAFLKQIILKVCNYLVSHNSNLVHLSLFQLSVSFLRIGILFGLYTLFQLNTSLFKLGMSLFWLSISPLQLSVLLLWLNTSFQLSILLWLNTSLFRLSILSLQHSISLLRLNTSLF